MKHAKSENVFEEPAATIVESLRAEARMKRRIVYDCFNAGVTESGVICRKGYEFKSIGRRKSMGVPLLGVLKGRTPSACADCPDYDNGGEEGDS